jgi:hypothetical protein
MLRYIIANNQVTEVTTSLAILFWFYKELDVCDNRLELLQRHNGDLRVYGLFGGEEADAGAFEARLGGRLADFYVAPPADRQWNWLNGDLMLLNWFERRGRGLVWDQIAVVQWDMLVLDAIRQQLPGMKAEEMYLSGLGTIDAAIENGWFWTSDGAHRPNYLRFKQHVREGYGYVRAPLHCGFIFQVIPRAFFDKYAGVAGREIGMLEYKVPTYAEIFGVPFYRRDLGLHAALNAVGREIPDDFIRRELEKPGGWRLFHPYYRTWDS